MKRTNDGLTASQRYAQRHPDRVKKARAKWKGANPDYAKAKAREYRQERPAHVKAIRLRSRYGRDAPRPPPPRCEACDGPYDYRGPCFDHDHTTGAFRGWLCNSCNIALGRVGDTIEGVRRLLVYMERANGSDAEGS